MVKLAVPMILISLLILSSADEKFENSSGICDRCGCSQTKTLFRINCESKDFTKVIANWPKTDATHMMATFSHNSIHRLEPMPPTAADIQLIFSHCNISELATGLLENCVNTTYLDLSHNLIKGDQLHTDVFKGPYNNTEFEPIGLVHLNLAYNKIHSLKKNIFEHMTKLRQLNLEGNHFRIWDAPTRSAFQHIPQLEELNVAKNAFVQVPEEILRNLTSLRKLDLSSNGLDFVPSGLAYTGRTLEILIIDNNPIIEMTDETFLGMENLIQLSAKNLKSLLQIKSNTFAHLDKLQKVDLTGMNNTHNKLEIDDKAFGNIKNLKELNMSNSQLVRLPVNLVNWTELEFLDINGNVFNCECEIFNISSMLPKHIKQLKNGPYCYDFGKSLQIEVYSVGSDLCYDPRYKNIPDASESSFNTMRIMRTSLLMLSVILIVSASILLWLTYSKCMTYRRSKQYPYASRVIYNPITTQIPSMLS